MASNPAVIFAEIPDGWPVPGKHLAIKDIGNADATAPPNGLVVQPLYLSLDPYLRGRMRDPKIKSYRPGFALDAPIENGGIAKVIHSNISGISPGDTIEGFMPFARTVVLQEGYAKMAKKLENPYGVDERYFLGALGMPGLTAYSGFYEIGKPKKGETIFISAASGAVGQIVGQLAKHEGLRVIGSVGSDDKLAHITEKLDFDGGFNYKKEKAADALARLAPEGIDIYFENVGAEQLEAALDSAKDFARFIMCGMISQYSAKPEERYGVKNLMNIVAKRITMRGFIVTDPDFQKYKAEHREKVGKWIKEGGFKVSQSETKGLENVPEGFVGMLKGENFGKAIVNLKDA